MKKILLFIIVLSTLVFGTAQAGNFLLTIDGNKYEVEVGKQTTVELSNGKKVEVILDKKAIVSFTAESFTFEHPGNVTPSRADLGDGIHQTMLATPHGSLILIQEYAGMDPSGLVDMMINELTKEEKKYGYKIINKPEKIKLSSGKTFVGKKSVAKYRNDQTNRQVLTYSIRDAGILIVTQIDKDAPSNDIAMIDEFWKTLKLSLK